MKTEPDAVAKSEGQTVNWTWMMETDPRVSNLVQNVRLMNEQVEAGLKYDHRPREDNNEQARQVREVAKMRDTYSAEYNRHRALCLLYRDLNNESRQRAPEQEPVPAQVPAAAAEHRTGANVHRPVGGLASPETERPDEAYIPLHDEDDDVIQPHDEQLTTIPPNNCPESTTNTHEQ